MTPKHFATLLFFLLLGTTTKVLAKTVVNVKCGFSLTMPQHWKFTRTPNHDVPCWYAVKSLHVNEPCSFLVRTVTEDLETAANHAGFKRRGGKWVMPPSYPLGETIDAEEISEKQWRGVKAEHAERGTQVSGEVDTTEVWTAVVSNGGMRSAVIEGFDCSDSSFDKLVESFRFLSTDTGTGQCIMKERPASEGGSGM